MSSTENRPAPFVTPWSENGMKFDIIPELADQKTNKDKADGKASMEEGFPEITMTSAMNGGVPPWGKDHNAILYRITKALQWIQTGGTAIFNQDLVDKISGYSKGAILQSINNPQTLWFSLIDGNMTDPDNSNSPENNWVKLSLEDIAYLRKRLDELYEEVGINTRLIASHGEQIHNIELLKAPLNGSCATSFHASTMQAGEYGFCDTIANTSIKEVKETIVSENGGRVMINACHFRTDSKYQFLTGDRKDGILTLEDYSNTYFTVHADLTTFNGGWVTFEVPITIHDAEVIMQNASNNKAWFQKIDESNMFTIGCYISGYHSQEEAKSSDNTAIEALKIIQATDDHFDIFAVSGSFVNGRSDLAEYYQADREDYEPGTLMCHGKNSEVTLCQNMDQADDFFGVISTKPGYVMNGNLAKDPTYVLIALNGKVPVKIKGTVKCGDKITIGQDGYGVVSTNKTDLIVARAKEDKITDEVDLVQCYVRAHC